MTDPAPDFDLKGRLTGVQLEQVIRSTRLRGKDPTLAYTALAALKDLGIDAHLVERPTRTTALEYWKGDDAVAYVKEQAQQALRIGEALLWLRAPAAPCSWFRILERVHHDLSEERSKYAFETVFIAANEAPPKSQPATSAWCDLHRKLRRALADAIDAGTSPRTPVPRVAPDPFVNLDPVPEVVDNTFSRSLLDSVKTFCAACHEDKRLGVWLFFAAEAAIEEEADRPVHVRHATYRTGDVTMEGSQFYVRPGDASGPVALMPVDRWHGLRIYQSPVVSSLPHPLKQGLSEHWSVLPPAKATPANSLASTRDALVDERARLFGDYQALMLDQRSAPTLDVSASGRRGPRL